MKRLLYPKVLAVRVSAKMGGVPFQVLFDVQGKKDQLILASGELLARSPGQTTSEYRAWGASEYGDLALQDVLAKVASQIKRIQILETEKGRAKPVRDFDSWKEFIAWLGDAEEKDVMFSIALPASLHMATKELAERRKDEGGEGSMRAVIIAALEEYHQRHD